jgi:hypothetical protein
MNILMLPYINKLWWRFMPGVTFDVAWPRGWIILDEDQDGGKNECETSDPNDHYRPWLEKHVGKQGWDWDWRVGSSQYASQYVDSDSTIETRLIIKFRQKHASFATYLSLRWS